MKNNLKLSLPEFITEAFPVLKDAEYIRSFAGLFILYPDTHFYLFQSASRDSLHSFILVATDYSDPLDQSYELKEITGRYEFEFTRIVAPYRNNKFIELRPHDDIEEVYDIRNPHGDWNYYLAEVTYRPDWTK